MATGEPHPEEAALVRLGDIIVGSGGEDFLEVFWLVAAGGDEDENAVSPRVGSESNG